jgi:hypothetical protein
MQLKEKPSMKYQSTQPTNKHRTIIGRIFHPFRRNITGSNPPPFETIGGVYATDVANASGKESIKTFDTQSSQDSTEAWISSDSPAHHEGSPLVLWIHRTDKADKRLSDEEILGRIMMRSRKLPQHPGCFASNHIMINSERTRRLIPPLTRCPEMDELAREQAARMASVNDLSHSHQADLQERLGQHCLRLGENMTRGPDIKTIHKAMITSLADRNNILDRRFTWMGIGTAKGPDGTLYLCQLFRG